MNTSKKLIRAILALMTGVALLAMTACGGSSKEDPKDKYIGYWKAVSVEMDGKTVKAEELDAEFYMDIREDGTAEAWMDGDASGESKWEVTDEGITITDPSGEESTAVLEGNELKMTLGNGDMVWTFKSHGNIPYLEDGGKDDGKTDKDKDDSGKDDGNNAVTGKTIKMSNPEGDIEFIKYEVVKTYDGEPLIRVYFKTKNNTKEAADAADSYYIKAYQDGVEMDMGWAFDDNEAEDNWGKEVRGGVELDVAYGYKLSNEKSPVTIRVEDYSEKNIMDDVYQEMVIDLK